MKIIEIETSITNDRNRHVTVTRRQIDDGPAELFLTIRDLEGPHDQEHGSAMLTAQQAELIADALLGRDDSCGAERWSPAALEALRARWDNVKPYDRGGLLSTHYRVDADGAVTDNDPNRYTGWHVQTGAEAECIADALDRARADRAWARDDFPDIDEMHHVWEQDLRGSVGAFAAVVDLLVDHFEKRHTKPIDHLAKGYGQLVERANRAEAAATPIVDPDTPVGQMVDAWLKVAHHPELALERLDSAPTLADAVYDRITELGEIARRAEDRFAALRADAATLGVHLPAEPGSAHSRVLDQAAEINDLKAQLANLKTAARLAGVVLHSDWNTTVPDDPAAYTVTEAEINAVEVVKHTTVRPNEIVTQWNTERRTVLPGETPGRLRESIDHHLQSVVELEAVARAMESDR